MHNEQFAFFLPLQQFCFEAFWFILFCMFFSAKIGYSCSNSFVLFLSFFPAPNCYFHYQLGIAFLVLLSPLTVIFLISWFLTFVVMNGCCIWKPSHCGPAACIFPCSVTLRVLSRCLPLSSSIPLCCGVLQATAVPSQPFFWLSLFIACFSIFLGSW